MSESNTKVKFADLNLPEPLAKAVESVGYEIPSPIQAECIPLLLEGNDLLGQAQTGTGKTAAFALPLLARIDLNSSEPQLLVLAPTRELAIQVAEAMQTYAHFLPNFHVLPIYGGQSYTIQLRQLKRGAQVIVGTPGRVMDHMRKGTLKLDALKALVLDEADEMLRMGFIDDVNWVLEHTPEDRQIALFSATMPKEIRRVAEKHLTNPKVVMIKSKTTTASTIRQRFWITSGLHKLDALTRVLETENFDGVIIFVRTKTATVELAEKLAARGFSAAALNGDIPQAQRETIVDRLKNGRLDLLVATDVVARGLDVKRISHVINFDIPYDTESYVHRIGRTGRAGREGEAILFVAPRERRMLKAIERATSQPIDSMEMPSAKDINLTRVSKFKQRIIDALGNEKDLSLFYQMVKEVETETDVDPLEIAAALACMNQGDVPLLLNENEKPQRKQRENRDGGFEREEKRGRSFEKVVETAPRRLKDHPEVEMERFRIEVGYDHGVKPGNIVGAIANEAELESQYIGHIEIFDEFSTIDLPAGMPDETFDELKNVWICRQKISIAHMPEGGEQQIAKATPPVPEGDKAKRGRGGDGKGRPFKGKGGRGRQGGDTGFKKGGKAKSHRKGGAVKAARPKLKLGKKD